MRYAEAIEFLQRANLHPDTEILLEFYDIEDVAAQLSVETASLAPLWSEVMERWNHTDHDLLTPLCDTAVTVAEEKGITLSPEE